MIEAIIAALIALGVITSADDFHNMTPDQQQEATEIVIDDIVEN